MNYRNIILFAAILAIVTLIIQPVSAGTWMNGNYYSDNEYAQITKGDRVVHDLVTGVDSKYNPNIGSLYDLSVDPNTYSGTAEVRIRSGMSMLNPTMTLINKAAPNLSTEIDVNDDTITDIPQLPPGDFTLTLHNLNLPVETADFTIRAGAQEPTYVTFVGQSGCRGQAVCPGDFEITSTQYGVVSNNHMTGTPDDVTATMRSHVNRATGIVTGPANPGGAGAAWLAFFGGHDPAPGVLKGIIIKYRNFYCANKILVIPDLTQSLPPGYYDQLTRVITLQ